MGTHISFFFFEVSKCGKFGTQSSQFVIWNSKFPVGNLELKVPCGKVGIHISGFVFEVSQCGKFGAKVPSVGSMELKVPSGKIKKGTLYQTFH